MKKIITIAFLSFLCFVYGYAGNHSMHPLKQIDYVLKQVKAQQEPYYSAYQQLIHDADSILKVPHHALVDFAVPTPWHCSGMHMPPTVRHWPTPYPANRNMEKKPAIS